MKRSKTGKSLLLRTTPGYFPYHELHCTSHELVGCSANPHLVKSKSILHLTRYNECQIIYRQRDIVTEGKLSPVLKWVCLAILTFIRQNISQADRAMDGLECCIKGTRWQPEDKGHCSCMLCMRPSWGRCALFPSHTAVTPTSKADRRKLLKFGILLGFRHGMLAPSLLLAQRKLF